MSAGVAQIADDFSGHRRSVRLNRRFVLDMFSLVWRNSNGSFRPIADIRRSVHNRRMGMLLDFVVDWFWVGLMLRLKRNNPTMFWLIIALELSFVAAIIGLAAYLSWGIR